MKNKIKVSIFCGGRGSRALIKSIQKRDDIDLTLLINAYDDGLSTGALRRFVPGMLGPSDFRKNLSTLFLLYSKERYNLQELIEYRLPKNFTPEDEKAFENFIYSGELTALPPELKGIIQQLNPELVTFIRDYLHKFFDYYKVHGGNENLELGDCSVGNLIFAAFYLENNHDFNKTVQALAKKFGIWGNLINVSQGECVTLTGVKKDGEILIDECSIVSKQSDTPIEEIFFIPPHIQPEIDLNDVKNLPHTEKMRWFKTHETVPAVSDECGTALEECDILIFGSGTQHSSLLPSYKILGEKIAKSPAKMKCFIVNLYHDHDIGGLNAQDLVDNALRYMDDPENSQRSITHIIYNNVFKLDDPVVFPKEILDKGEYKGAKIITGNFASPLKLTHHNGTQTINTILKEYNKPLNEKKLTIYLNPLQERQSAAALLEEISEIAWPEYFLNTIVYLPADKQNGTPENLKKLQENLPDWLTIRFHDYGDEISFPGKALEEWWNDPEKTDFLAILTGDGEYKLTDVIKAINVMDKSNFGVVLGSRVQSRQQFHKSLDSAYGEKPFLYFLGRMGAFVATSVLAMRFGHIFSDPLTGFLVFQRKNLAANLFHEGNLNSSSNFMPRLLAEKVEMAELPVTYKTFSGFTNLDWRWKRGLAHIRDFLIK